MTASSTAMFCNGYAADVAALGAALVNHGHFTSLQVRGGCVQGLDLHLHRLQQATPVLFGSVLDATQVQRWMADAVQQAGVVDASLRITVFSRRFDFRDPLASVPVDVLIAVAAPVQLSAARSVRTVHYQRDLPALKHVGTFGLFQQRREAMAAGFDDALFIGADGQVSEGTTWNLALHDGEQLLWPQAPALRGVAESLLRRHWDVPQVARAVPAGELAGISAAFACNASGIWPLACLDGRPLAGSAELAEQATAVMSKVPWHPLRPTR